MKLPPRCLISDVDDAHPTLDAPARHHVERVLRLVPGDVLELVDGRGGLARAELARGGCLTVTERAPRQAPESAPLWLAVAPPRPSRLDWLVEKAVELGVTELFLLDAAHAVREPGASRLLRLQRIADEALLQCRRLFRARVHGSRPLAEILARDAERWLAEVPREGEDAPGAVPPRPTERPLLLLVGPEGGFRADERAAVLARGARPVACGRGVLRVETAALALAALAAH